MQRRVKAWLAGAVITPWLDTVRVDEVIEIQHWHAVFLHHPFRRRVESLHIAVKTWRVDKAGGRVCQIRRHWCRRCEEHLGAVALPMLLDCLSYLSKQGAVPEQCRHEAASISLAVGTAWMAEVRA